MKFFDYIAPSREEINPVQAGRRTCWKGSQSQSSSSTATTTQNTDKRQVVDNGVGVSSDSSTVTVNVLDEGIVKAALDTVSAADAVSGQGFTQLLGLADRLFVGAGEVSEVSGRGFTQLLGLADKLFVGAGEVIGKTQDTALSQIGQVNSAKNDAKGAIDQKTIVVLAIAGAAALVLSKKGGK